MSQPTDRAASSATAAPSDVPELIPARMLNEFAYCPRLAYLEWAKGDFADSADTVEGRFHHRKVDQETGALPTPDRLGEAPAIETFHGGPIEAIQTRQGARSEEIA